MPRKKRFFIYFIHIIKTDAISACDPLKVFDKLSHLLCWHSTQAVWVVPSSESSFSNTCISWHEMEPLDWRRTCDFFPPVNQGGRENTKQCSESINIGIANRIDY